MIRKVQYGAAVKTGMHIAVLDLVIQGESPGITVIVAVDQGEGKKF